MMIHSLRQQGSFYELVSNASDACDKLRFERNDGALLEDDTAFRIRVSYNPRRARSHLGQRHRPVAPGGRRQIALSRSPAWNSSAVSLLIPQKDAQLIGQFGGLLLVLHRGGSCAARHTPGGGARRPGRPMGEHRRGRIHRREPPERYERYGRHPAPSP